MRPENWNEKVVVFPLLFIVQPLSKTPFQQTQFQPQSRTIVPNYDLTYQLLCIVGSAIWYLCINSQNFQDMVLDTLRVIWFEKG